MAALSTEEARRQLNGHARYILSKGDLGSYDAFLAEYDEMIDRSWYIPQKPTGYQIFNYTLSEYSAKGAFGSVYRATDEAGNEIALKLLKREIRGDAASIHAFRRGVEAMKILETRTVEGMVAYRDASEIPTFVTMEWVEGPNLQAAKEARLIEDWQTILDVFIQAASIIYSAHSLPEKVLHRDIRPANIMLRDGWTSIDTHNVVVLDFDLATYSGAKTESVIAEGSALGYLAPEQMESKAASRSAIVDSFGLGMTLYYMAGRQEPFPYMQRSGGYLKAVRDAANTPESPQYKATARRIERVILNATKDSQRERWSLDLILAETRRIRAANDEGKAPLDADLAAEEIAANSDYIANKYTWEPYSDVAHYDVASGPTVRIQGTINSFDVHLELTWADQGTLNRTKVSKYLGDRINQAVAALIKSGWNVMKQNATNRQATISARYRVEADTDYRLLGRSVDSAIGLMVFD